MLPSVDGSAEDEYGFEAFGVGSYHVANAAQWWVALEESLLVVSHRSLEAQLSAAS